MLSTKSISATDAANEESSKLLIPSTEYIPSLERDLYAAPNEFTIPLYMSLSHRSRNTFVITKKRELKSITDVIRSK